MDISIDQVLKVKAVELAVDLATKGVLDVTQVSVVESAREIYEFLKN